MKTKIYIIFNLVFSSDEVLISGCASLTSSGVTFLQVRNLKHNLKENLKQNLKQTKASNTVNKLCMICFGNVKLSK